MRAERSRLMLFALSPAVALAVAAHLLVNAAAKSPVAPARRFTRSSTRVAGGYIPHDSMNGARAVARRRRQIERGILQVSA